MKNEILHDLIERYLDAELSDIERQEVEHRLSTDAGFRAEVELQRAIKTHIGNPSEVQLRFALDDMWKDIEVGQDQSPPKTKKWSPYLIAGLALVLLVSGWWWFRASQTTTPEQPAGEPPTLPAPAPKQDRLHEEPPQSPPTKETSKRPIAMADPADFVPNPDLEVRIGGIRGESDLYIDLSSPAPGAAFLLINKRITLRVNGLMDADSDAVRQPIRLFIYSNRPKDWENKQALFNFLLPFKPVAKGQYRFDFQQQLRLRQGLYYFVAGQERTMDAGGGYRTLWVGKFTVQKE